jgi:molybdopterin molybdotransferase
VVPLKPFTVGLDDALGAVVGVDVVAAVALPAADVSAMDGWAVRGPGPWLVVGRVLAGSGAVDQPLISGTCVEIATGALVPREAVGVLRSEFGQLEGELVRHDPAGGPIGDIRPAGGECRVGDVVVEAGTLITPAVLGLLAATGFDTVCIRRADVELFVLGDEIVEQGLPGPGRVRDAIGPLARGWFSSQGVRLRIGRVTDALDDLVEQIGRSTADLVLTSGSSAHGPADHVHGALAALGARLLVDGVAVRPGHPQLFALLPDGRPVIGLPGNPLGAVSALLTLAQPAVDALAGRTARVRRTIRIAVDVSAGGQATRLVPVNEGRPVMFAGPAMLRGLAGADAVAVIPPGGVRAGEEVDVVLLT